MTKGGLYHHAVSTAIVSEQIAKLTGRAAPDVAYTAGLLHDIGKVHLDQYVSAAAPMFYCEVYEEGRDLLAVEKSLLGITHIEAGMRLAELWSFPPSLTDAIANHGHPELAQHDKTLAHVIHLADLLILRFAPGHEIEMLSTDGLEKRLQPLGLDKNSLLELIAGLPWKMLGTPGFF